jgi:putative salt-induced outer membrane protein YdiY
VYCSTLLLALLVASALPTRADVFRLKSGETVIGSVVSEDEGSVVIVSPILGTVRLERDQILQREKEKPSATEPQVTPAPAVESTGKPESPLFPIGYTKWQPPDDGFDWIELTSGEWLKGELKAMQNYELEFDSDELDLQTFDWDDVRQVRSPQYLDLLFEDRTRASGPITVTPDKVRVGDSAPREFPRDQVLGITPGGKKERRYWSGKLSAGLTFRSGNSDEAEWNANFDLRRLTPATRFQLSYIGYFSSTEGQKTANSHKASGLFDIRLSRRTFIRAPFAEYFRDPFQNTAHRATVGVGFGYEIIDGPRVDWNVAAGPAYQITWFESVQPGEDESKATPAVMLTSRFDWEVSKRVDLLLNYTGIYTSAEAAETTHHMETTLEVELSSVLDLDVSIYWDRVSQPKRDSDGNLPKPDDFRTVVALGVDF